MPDPAASVCLSSRCTPRQFAPEVAKAFFPAYDQAPPRFDCPYNLPPEPAAPLPEIPPWLKAQASDNRQLTRLRQSNRQVEQEDVVTTIDDSLAGSTAISTSMFYSVPKERPKRFLHANLLDVIDTNECDFSADDRSEEEVSGVTKRPSQPRLKKLR
ncbi:hypothetical protein HPB52_004570 [Rhipicephalus sanguineus]|uniref:Uncharacterized protein n=1 Tax=Rhipicephalus sanguineus TaxID=34632 RepID=A0A9D4SNB8_RHISA|nr:hypothetical protein HPB52_004570 [Rhipicephalus sanguineus]